MIFYFFFNRWHCISSQKLITNTFPLVYQYTEYQSHSTNFSFSVFFSFASLLKAEYEFISSGLYLVVLLHLCEQSFSDMMGNTNEPSTRVRVSNIGVGGKGAMLQVFALESTFFYMFTFYFGGGALILKCILKIKILQI